MLGPPTVGRIDHSKRLGIEQLELICAPKDIGPLRSSRFLLQIAHL